MQKVRIALVEMEPLLEDRFIVEVQGQPGRIIGTWSLERTMCLRFKRVRRIPLPAVSIQRRSRSPDRSPRHRSAKGVRSAEYSTQITACRDIGWSPA